jgi:hypothetical protein
MVCALQLLSITFIGGEHAEVLICHTLGNYSRIKYSTYMTDYNSISQFF